ncbi:MAG: hypothetical protein WC683_02630 [bacterium]
MLVVPADVVAQLHELGWEADVGYSGRGMRGACCVAVRLKAWSDLYRLGLCLGENGLLLGTPHIDNLGSGIVAYWPELKTWEAKL